MGKYDRILEEFIEGCAEYVCLCESSRSMWTMCRFYQSLGDKCEGSGPHSSLNSWESQSQWEKCGGVIQYRNAIFRLQDLSPVNMPRHKASQTVRPSRISKRYLSYAGGPPFSWLGVRVQSDSRAWGGKMRGPASHDRAK